MPDQHDAALRRLAGTRQALMREFDHTDWPGPSAGEEPRAQSTHADSGTTVSMIQHVLRSWWRRHPASAATGLVMPVLRHYAREKPVELLAIAAGLGAATMLLRPWRLVSIGGLAGLAMTALRSPDAAALARAAMGGRAPKDGRDRT